MRATLEVFGLVALALVGAENVKVRCELRALDDAYEHVLRQNLGERTILDQLKPGKAVLMRRGKSALICGEISLDKHAGRASR